jgi:hypothetical protein
MVRIRLPSRLESRIQVENRVRTAEARRTAYFNGTVSLAGASAAELKVTVPPSREAPA